MAPADLGRMLLLAAAWGLAFVFIRVAVPPLGPVALVELRQLIAGSLLLTYLSSVGIALDFRRRWPTFLTLALLNSALPFTLIATAQQVLTASYTVILVSTSPLFAALIAAVVLREPLTARKLGGLALGIAGVALLVGWNPAGESLPPVWTIAFVLAAAALYAIAGVYTRVVAQGIPPLATAAGSQLGAALLLAPLVPALPPAAMPSPLAWASVLALALASSALAFILYFQLIRNVGPVKTLTVNFLTPLFGVGGGVLLLGERVTANMVAGTAIILVATALVLGVGSTRAAPEP
jgi:drug/metabolite transporter (DMT)-like permease